MGLLDDILQGLPVNPLLREKVAELEAKHAATETENAILKDDLRDAKAEIAKLKNQVEELTHIDLDDTALAIIKLLASNDLFEQTIAHNLQLPPATIKFYLGQLSNQGYVTSKKPMRTRPTYYLLTQKGLECAHKNKLV